MNSKAPRPLSDMPSAEHSRDREEDVLTRLDIEFRRLNETHFEGRLNKPVIQFSKRKTYGGYYHKTSDRIVLSWQAYLEHGWDETVNTFRHEVAHIVHQHHRETFWELAAQLGVTRKYAAAPLKPIQRRSRWYTYQCPSCEGLLKRRRRLSTNASCSRCDTKFNPAYKLVLLGHEVR